MNPDIGVTGMLSHKRGGHSSLVLQAQMVIHQGAYRPLRTVTISGVLQSQILMKLRWWSFSGLHSVMQYFGTPNITNYFKNLPHNQVK